MMASMDAVAQQAPGAAVQHAKLLWAVNEPHRAILQLQEVSAARWATHPPKAHVPP